VAAAAAEAATAGKREKWHERTHLGLQEEGAVP
jgi:hypothetical protein